MDWHREGLGGGGGVGVGGWGTKKNLKILFAENINYPALVEKTRISNVFFLMGVVTRPKCTKIEGNALTF